MPARSDRPDGPSPARDYPPADPRGYRRALAWLLLISWGLRVWLACRGGELFWPDEGRYVLAETAAGELWRGHWRLAASGLLGQGQHTLFPVFSLVPAVAERFTGLHLPLVASYFGLFSVGSIYLIWAVARRAGAAEAEALWAAFLAACANSLFYYSRHFLPYDISLCLMLGAFWLALGPWSWRNSLRVGLAAGLGFLSYNGYWWLGGCVLVLHALLGAGGHRRIWLRAACSGLALGGTILLVLGLSRLLGHNLIGDDARDARGAGASLSFGDLSSGPRVIAGYLWHTESGFLLLLAAASGYALLRAGRDRRLAWYAGGGLLVVSGLVFLSDPVLFPVFGRRVRELVPFLCLGAAAGIVRFVQARPRARRIWTAGIAGLAAGLAAWNFSGPLRQVFPDEFRRLAAATAARQSGYQAYRLVFLQKTLFGERLDATWPSYRTVLRRPHPLQFRPYQYEGYDAAQRAELNRRDVAMRLLGLPGRFDDGDARWAGYPGPVRLVVRFPAGAAGRSESLVATGQAGRADIFYVRYEDATHVRFGLDHWGVGATNSAPIAVDYSRPHELILLAGFLLPPAESPPPGPEHELSRLRDRLVVLLDGRQVFALTEHFFPAPRATLSFGLSFIAGSSEDAEFSGDILEFGAAPASALAVVRPASP